MTVLICHVWIAFFLGILVGWIWKPKWFVVFASVPVIPSEEIDIGVNEQLITVLPLPQNRNCSLTELSELSELSEYKEEECCVVSVTEDDFKHLCHLIDKKDGGPPWKHMMEHSTPDMSYQASQRDPETGPPQLCVRTVYEDATPEMLRDFFWDDTFRLKWDDMIIRAVTLEECPTTGTMVVHWIRKFPFFCSNREYIIGRRIWESGRTYFCVTKGVPCTSVPRQKKPRRVDLYYSSWSIQAVESRKGDGELSACEVILFHHEDMGIPREIAKFGARQGMWGTVKKIERGFRAYQKERGSGAPLSRSAFMACINTKIDPNYLNCSEDDAGDSPEKGDGALGPAKAPTGGLSIPKTLLFGGAVLLVCSFKRGLLTKTVASVVARRFANVVRRMRQRT